MTSQIRMTPYTVSLRETDAQRVDRLAHKEGLKRSTWLRRAVLYALEAEDANSRAVTA